jgi:hypothetical protein
MPDPWIAIEESALAVVAAVAQRRPLDRGELERALHVFAIAKNRDLGQMLPDMTVFTDDQVVEMVGALVRGNHLGG